MGQDRERLAASDLLPPWDVIRQRLAENYTERHILLSLDRLARKANQERRRLLDLAEDAKLTPVDARA